MAKLIYENRFILTRKLHKEYYRFRYMKLKFRFLYYLGYRLREWWNYRGLQAEHGEAVVNVVKFYSDQIHVQVNKTGFSFKYATIEGADETEELLVLRLSAPGMAGHVQFIYKNGFVGKPELSGFKEYINTRTGKEIFSEPHTDGEETDA